MKLRYKYAAYCLAIKNDFCLEESISELYRQGVKQVMILCPDEYWTTRTPQRESDFSDLAQIATRTNSSLVRTHFAAVAYKGNNALYTEALYRNFAVSALTRENDIDFVLTVDADELWLPGTLEHVDSTLEPGCSRVDLPGIPVLGLPGLPVEGAKDTILAATARGVKFTWGRATVDCAKKLGTVPIIHFSATRRTMDEIISKMRLSAHYTDPTYDFDGWIQNTLPNVHVGMKNVHMYRSSDNIWPSVRAWTASELELIPKTLHPFLSHAKA